MTFNSIDEAIAYIERAVASAMPECADEIKFIMDKETQAQVKGWSGDIFSSVVPHSDNTSAEAGFEDTGGWTSLISGELVGNPIKFLEAGTTWFRDASNIMDTSFNECEAEIPDKLKAILIGMGIPIQ